MAISCFYLLVVRFLVAVQVRMARSGWATPGVRSAWLMAVTPIPQLPGDRRPGPLFSDAGLRGANSTKRRRAESTMRMMCRPCSGWDDDAAESNPRSLAWEFCDRYARHLARGTYKPASFPGRGRRSRWRDDAGVDTGWLRSVRRALRRRHHRRHLGLVGQSVSVARARTEAVRACQPQRSSEADGQRDEQLRPAIHARGAQQQRARRIHDLDHYRAAQRAGGQRLAAPTRPVGDFILAKTVPAVLVRRRRQHVWRQGLLRAPHQAVALAP